MAIHSPRKLTYEDFEKIPEDGQRHEIIDGVHFVSPSPVTIQQRVSFRLARKLADFVEREGLGEVFIAPFDVVLSEHDIVVPDILFISTNRSDVVTEKNAQGAPDLVIEVLSPGTRRRDLGIKLARYEKLGVLEYWILDSKAGTILIFRREGDHFLPPIRLAAESDDRLTSPLFPGLEISLREVFAE